MRPRPARKPLLLGLVLLATLGGTWSTFFCYFSWRHHQQQQHQHQHQLPPQPALQLATVLGPAPIGPRVLQPQATAAERDGAPPAVVVYKDFEHDTHCLQQGQGQVFFMHMRKAGGTAVAKVLRQLYEALPEGTFRFALIEGPTFNTSCFDERSRVFVTTLRHPIDRIVSSYYYEGRYRRFDARMFHDQAEADLVKALMAETKNRRTLRDTPLGFREWVEETRREYYQRETASYRKENVWLSVENYYIKTLVNRHRADTTKPVTRADLELAKRM